MIDRNVPPPEHDLALGAHPALDLLLACEPRCALLGHEHHPDPVLAGGRQGHALPGHVLPVEPIRDLDEDAGAVSLERIRADGTTVIEVLQDLKSVEDDLVALPALDVGYETDATGIVLIYGVVKTLLLGRIHHDHPRHFDWSAGADMKRAKKSPIHLY